MTLIDDPTTAYYSRPAEFEKGEIEKIKKIRKTM